MSIVLQLTEVLEQVIALITTKKVTQKEFVKRVVVAEQNALMSTNEVIPYVLLHSWLNYVRNKRFTPQEHHAARHLPFIRAVLDEAMKEKFTHQPSCDILYAVCEEPFSAIVCIDRMPRKAFLLRMRSMRAYNPRRITILKTVALDTPQKIAMADYFLSNAMAPFRTHHAWFGCADRNTLQTIAALLDKIEQEKLAIPSFTK